MCLLAGVLLIEVLLAGVLPLAVLLAVEGEMVLAESLFLGEKEKIPLEWEISEEEKEMESEDLESEEAAPRAGEPIKKRPIVLEDEDDDGCAHSNLSWPGGTASFSTRSAISAKSPGSLKSL